MSVTNPTSLTGSQAARRDRVVETAIHLAAEGGYDAVQMRAVAAKADVALGTIYRYFSSKDHLLAAAMVEWMEDLERRVADRPPQGDTPAARVVEVLGRALTALGRRPSLAAAVVAAQTSGDAQAGRAHEASTETLVRIMAGALPADTDPDRLADVTRVLGHVFFSCLVVWANGIQDLDWVASEVSVAAHLLLTDI